ncbi:MAG: hypothetical protein U5M51_12560 [Emticicia sp.]|nr:hypothetical protein [Emticicia sp.]
MSTEDTSLPAMKMAIKTRGKGMLIKGVVFILMEEDSITMKSF